MRYFSLFCAALLSFSVLFLLQNKLSNKLPALGKLLDPVKGVWANAEATSFDGSTIIIPTSGLQKPVELNFNKRMVPHIQAFNDKDLYFTQGYLHAYFRLWQMDMQVRAASGTLSEILGEQYVQYDRGQRRKGMVFGAKNSLKAMENNPTSKMLLDSYTRGVNAFINELGYTKYPLEYKLMGYAPEPWTNLNTALVMKMLADGLTGKVDDIAMSYLKNDLSMSEIDELFPVYRRTSTPVIPRTESFNAMRVPLKSIPSGDILADLAWNDSTSSVTSVVDLSHGIGSNNWAVSGNVTQSGAAILATDPHLNLSLPAVWFEQQLSSIGVKVYGVSVPGAPGVIIGFNDSIAWGLTNNYRDVKDYFKIVTSTMDARFYVFDDKDVPFNYVVETIRVKDMPNVIDSVRYTIHGPVEYDASFALPGGGNECLAVSWMGHIGSNEVLALFNVNRSKNYEHFVNAIQDFSCPAQNFAFSDIYGNVAIWGQGLFVDKFENQGRFVMRGDISSTMWKDFIVPSQNPHVINPSQQYVASANQQVTSYMYPYWYNGYFADFRAWSINNLLTQRIADTTRTKISIEEMMQMQQNTHSVLADSMYVFFKTNVATLGDSALVQAVSLWDRNMDAKSEMATYFQIWWDDMYSKLWTNSFGKYQPKLAPSPEITMHLLLSCERNQKANMQIANYKRIAQESIVKAADSLGKLRAINGASWSSWRNSNIEHLTKIKAFGIVELQNGGYGNTINAMKGGHGPSWRMVVSLQKDLPLAYVIYPGGQSGNPGSKYYSDFVEDWVAGKYYKVNFIP